MACTLNLETLSSFFFIDFILKGVRSHPNEEMLLFGSCISWMSKKHNSHRMQWALSSIHILTHEYKNRSKGRKTNWPLLCYNYALSFMYWLALQKSHHQLTTWYNAYLAHSYSASSQTPPIATFPGNCFLGCATLLSLASNTDIHRINIFYIWINTCAPALRLSSLFSSPQTCTSGCSEGVGKRSYGRRWTPSDTGLQSSKC